MVCLFFVKCSCIILLLRANVHRSRLFVMSMCCIGVPGKALYELNIIIIKKVQTKFFFCWQ